MDAFDPDVDLIVLRVINVTMFFGLNWVFLFMNILNVYHVRHIRDRLEIRKEMTYIVVFWSFFCLLQYLWYLLGQTADDGCGNDFTAVGFMLKLELDLNQLTYYTIICRDLAVLAITVIFLVRVGRRENSLKEQLAKSEDVLDAMDLYTVLDSVTPLMAFSKYLEE